MKTQFTTTPIKQALTFPFQDQHWQSKLMIGMLVMLTVYVIPVIPMLIIYGYLYQIMHRILVGDGELHLPEWHDWGKYLADGWRLFLVNFIYTLPAALFYFAGMVIYFVGVFGLSIYSAESSSTDPAFLLIFVFLGIMILCILIAMVLGICASLMMPPAICNTVKNDTYKAAFRFSEWWPVLKANISGFLIALLIIFGMFMILMFVSQILYMTMICCFLMFFVNIIGGYYLALVVAALIPLVYKEGLEKLEGQAV